MTEKEKISISIQDEIFKQAQPICDKLNECFLDFKDFNNIKMEPFVLHTGVTDYNYYMKNKLRFKKYESYKNRRLLTMKHLKKNALFTEFHFLEGMIGKLKKDDIDLYKEYIECFEIFAEYIGYEMKIEKWDYFISKVEFKMIE